MRHLGSILVLGSETADDRDLCVRLKVNGYEPRLVTSLEATLASFAQEHPDLVIILADAESNPADAVRDLRTADGGATVPICIASRSHELAARIPAMAPDCDDYVTPPLYDAKLVAHLRPLLRLATMRAELRLRSAAALRMGAQPAPPPPRGESVKALIVGELGMAEAALAEVEVHRINDPGIAVDTLHGKHFDLAVLVPGEDAPTYLDLCQRIRTSPSLFNLPVAVIGHSDARIEEASYNSGASAYLDTSIGEDALGAAIKALVRRQRTRLHLSRALRGTLVEQTRGVARAYSSAFFDEYLSERFEFAQQFGRQLTMLRVQCEDVAGVRARFGDVQAEDLVRALEQWIAQLTRIEDMLATLPGPEFMLVLPDTPRAEAAAVAARILGVIGQVEFALTEVYEGIRVHVGVYGAVLRPGESLAEFTKRARNELI